MADLDIRLPYQWDPRPEQLALWCYLQGGGLRAIDIAHRRFGKDDVALRWTSVATQQRVGNYWHMLPEYGQARKAVWEAINPKTGHYRIDDAFPQALRASTRNTDMVIQFKNGSQWQLVGSDNYNSVVGSPPVGVVFSEWALANPLAWAYIQPILEENGGWALFITSSRGNNHAFRTYDSAKANPKWYADIHRADQTSVFSQAQLDEIKQNLVDIYGPESGLTIFNQEYLCSREGAILGAYYAKQMEDAWKEGRIGHVPHRPDLEVMTAWDLGIDDSMTIWFVQRVGQMFHVIDYFEDSGRGLEYYARIMREGHRKKYLYSEHFMPHDAEIRELSSGDIARSREDVAKDLGIEPITVVPRARNVNVIVQVHIPAVRNILPLCRFDKDLCSKGIAALEGYQSKFDEKTKVLGTSPMHNWCSHGADGFRTFAVGYEDLVPKPAQRKSKILEMLSGFTGGRSGGNNWSGL